MKILEPSTLQSILQVLLSRGGNFAEVFVERRVNHSMRIDDGHIEEAAVGEDHGVALRLVDGGRTLFSSTNRTDEVGLEDAAAHLAATLAGEPRAEAQPFGAPRGEEPPGVDRLPSEVSLEEKADLLRTADRAARVYDHRVQQCTAFYADSERWTQVANSDGVLEDDRLVFTTLFCNVLARQGADTRTATELVSESRGFELFRQHPAHKVAQEAARVAVLQLDARPAPAGTFTVVLSSQAGGTMVHEACGHGLEGDFVAKDLSVYAGKLGEKVAADVITVVDDGTLGYLRGTARIDDEGNPTSRVVLIENGILRGYLHSRRSAQELGLQATGNGRRESYRYPPIPRMRNTFIEPGFSDPEEILQSVADGIFVARMGGGEVDITSGKFVFAVSEAYRIRDGKLAEPIRDASLIGAGPEVLSSIDRVGNDLGFGVGTCGKDGQGVPVADAQPTLRIPRIVVGGTAAGDGEDA
jgi:TldD protein